jgi:hypothetical protein
MDTVQTATTEFLARQIDEKDARITQLEESHARLAQRDMHTAATLNKLREDLKDWTRNELREDNITQEQAEALAQLGDFKLTQAYDVTMLVEHTFTVELQSDEDIDDVISTIEFSADSYHTELINSDYSVSESNYDENDY